MKRDLFHRYVWLVSTIFNGNKPTFEDIAKAWNISPLNDDASPLALRTFHNHRDAVEHLFGIRILCNRSDNNYYYIAEDPEAYTLLKIWMLQTLSLSNSIHRSSSLANRILLDSVPEEKNALVYVLDAMKREKCLDFTLTTTGPDKEYRAAPYCVRLWDNSWYMLGQNPETMQMQVYKISDMREPKISDCRFQYPFDFDARGYFSHYYGMEIEPHGEPESVRIKLSGHALREVSEHPLHSSQREIYSKNDYAIFHYNLVLSREFINTLLSFGPDCEVMAPDSLRLKLKDIISRMQQTYEEVDEHSKAVDF